MRRQARISAGGALIVRTASALQVWLWLLIFVFQNEFRISGSIQPGYLDFDNLPETNFTCAGKVIGGYYADLETSCQMFHVCTVGQQDEPMDIKFLCLNGTVFDQETRVCERVDEVDCTKSEKFYNLNLELYGSTLAPPAVQSEKTETKTQTTELSKQSPKYNHDEADPSLDHIPSTTRKKEPSSEVIDFTEDPVIDTKKEEKPSSGFSPNEPVSLHNREPNEDNQEEEEIDSEIPEYEDDYAQPTTTTQVPRTTSTSISPPTSTLQQKILQKPSSLLHLVSSPLPVTSLASPTSSSAPASSVSSLDPSLLSPQEFIYRHRGPGSEAISFQRQSFRPADGVYITHAPPPQHQQFEHFQYESSRTAPRPAPFVQRPQPFRPTTTDPRDQLLRPGPNSQSSERHETSIKHRPSLYPPQLSAQRPIPFDPFYFEHKRSEDTLRENQSSLAARSVAPVTVTERPPTKPKSPPRVIVTASASVSDSNGKRLNYTVGNVVSAVKPIVPINYDDYKESDLIFDPFFLDVPKLQKRRKTRSNKNKRVITVPDMNIVSKKISSKAKIKQTTLSSVTSQATTTVIPIVETISSTTQVTTTTAAWNPDDYVDDNYEPHAYNMHPVPPLASFDPHKESNFNKLDRQSTNHLVISTAGHSQKIKIEVVEQARPISLSSTAQSLSSQGAGVAAATLPAAPPAAPPPLLPPAPAPPPVDARLNQFPLH